MNERVRSARRRSAGARTQSCWHSDWNVGALATPQSFNYRGTPLLTGGVSEEERERWRDLGPYNVWLAFAERDTGNT